MSTANTHKLPKVTVVKCPCGDKICKTYGLSFGTFYQGSGWSQADAEEIARRINAGEQKLRPPEKISAAESAEQARKIPK